MNVGLNRTVVRLSIGIASAGVIVNAVSGSLLLVFGFDFLYEPSLLPMFETWFDAVATTGAVLMYAMLPVAGIGSFYLVTVKNENIKNVVMGFVLGGVVFGLGVAFTSWAVSQPMYKPLMESLIEYIGMGVVLSGIFVGMAILGSLGGNIIRPALKKSAQ